MRNNRDYKMVRIPSSPPGNKTELNRIVATNGLTVRFSLILQIPKFCSYYRKIVNKNSVLDNHATQNATRKSRFSTIKNPPKPQLRGKYLINLSVAYLIPNIYNHNLQYFSWIIVVKYYYYIEQNLYIVILG